MKLSIRKYISDVCKNLGIKCPIIIYTSNLQTDTTMVQYNLEQNEIMIPPIDDLSHDYLFAIAHELRHAWQKQDDPEWFFANYKPSTELDNESYNLQFAEIDANAYAAIVIENIFHLSPQWNNLTDRVVFEIERRMDQIISHGNIIGD